MSRWAGKLRSLKGWWAAWVLLLLGTGLIVSERWEARRNHQRPWIVAEPPTAVRADAEEAWPQILQKAASPLRHHELTEERDLEILLRDLAELYRIETFADYRALGRFGIHRSSRVRFSANPKSIAEELNQLVASLSNSAAGKHQVIWKALSDRTIILTTALEQTTKQQWRSQRQKEANPQLRAELDRKIPYLRVDMDVDEALRYCERISGVKIVQRFNASQSAAKLYFSSHDLTFENAIELILKEASGDGPALRFKAERDALIVFREGDAP